MRFEQIIRPVHDVPRPGIPATNRRKQQGNSYGSDQNGPVRMGDLFHGEVFLRQVRFSKPRRVVYTVYGEKGKKGRLPGFIDALCRML
jgi:hypothetical protein